MEQERIFRSPDGQYYTLALFLETSYEDPSLALYTMKRKDYEYKGRTYLSFPRLYMEIADPTEFQVAELLFDGWPHWTKLQGSSKLSPLISGLREELEVKLRSEGIKKLIAAGRNGSEKASTWLAEKGWVKSGAGRPTQEAIKREARKLTSIKDTVADDAERMQEFRK